MVLLAYAIGLLVLVGEEEALRSGIDRMYGDGDGGEGRGELSFPLPFWSWSWSAGEEGQEMAALLWSIHPAETEAEVRSG